MGLVIEPMLRFLSVLFFDLSPSIRRNLSASATICICRSVMISSVR
jgi:hypothetical protein